MSDIAIRVENLSKLYYIGTAQRRHDTLRDAIASRASGVGNLAARLANRQAPIRSSESDETLWALQNVSFEVKRGEVVGIIGRNGAGKSTLLKILARVTEPTKGRAIINGRVGSLLEVGTGFHPELTGRENIYLNGAILGMKRTEINRKFDEIIAFSEIERFLDTPVKHYSSGMYVRLAFAVAAHLEPEILFVDEVLAVGDAAFQKKCLGKLGDVARSGRTVLFISHNVAAVRSLCTRGFYLEQGLLVSDADIQTVIGAYLSEDSRSVASVSWNEDNRPQSSEIRFSKAYVLNDRGEIASTIDCRRQFSIVLEYEITQPLKGLRIGFALQNTMGILLSGSTDEEAWENDTRAPGHYASVCVFPRNILNADSYSIMFGADLPPYDKPLVSTDFCLEFMVEDVTGHGSRHQKLPGVTRPDLSWSVIHKRD